MWLEIHRLTLPSARTLKMACSMLAASLFRLMCRSIIMELRRSAVGLASCLPSISGAEPWTASKMEHLSPMFPDGVRPRPPIRPAHDEHLVVVGRGVGDHLQAGVVEQLGVELNVGEVLGHLARGAEEEAVGHLHDGGLVHGAHLLPANVAGVLEGVPQHALRSLAGDELDALHDAVNDNVLDARVFALGVLSDQDRCRRASCSLGWICMVGRWRRG
jgi:hypothetical protein